MTDDERKQLMLQLKEEIQDIEHTMDTLHKEEASILADIDALERKAKEHNLTDIEHQLLAAFTQLVAAGSLMAQVSIDLQVPPTIFEPVLKPHEQPRQVSEEQASKEQHDEAA